MEDKEKGIFKTGNTGIIVFLLKVSRNFWLYLEIQVLLTPKFSFQYNLILYSCWNQGMVSGLYLPLY